MLENERIKVLAAEAGFDLCGVARCRHLAEGERIFREWLDAGCSAGLGYLARNLDKRFDPSKLVEGAKTVIVCAAGYKNRTSDGYPDGSRAKVASYACTTDYHTTIKSMLHKLLDALKACSPTLAGRAFVDSAPLLEKQFAIEAGLGWRGRQSLLITPRLGSFVLLGELVVTDEADRYDTPLEGVGCGECRRCIDACPTGAILPSGMVDASRCISCATVEANISRNGSGEDSANDLHGWIFGCDECQSCCPYNRRAPYHRSDAFDPLFDPQDISTGEWLAMQDSEFAERFGSTPLMRSGLNTIKRNIR